MISKINRLKEIARDIRIDIVKMIAEAGSGHPAGSLGVVDILVALYFNVLKHNFKDPFWEERDRFLLSAGHLCPALYAVLAQAGYFSKKELLTLRKLGARLRGHSHRNSPPGVEISAGSLGQGLSIACGMAAAAKLDKKNYRVVCLTSDGEHNEGQVWEAAMFASKYKLNNLVNIIDRNFIQIDGKTEKIMPLLSLKKKYRSFGWRVFQIDGHDLEKVIIAFKRAFRVKKRPSVIIAKTTPGKGVCFMEGKWQWHGRAPDKEEIRMAIKELKW